MNSGGIENGDGSGGGFSMFSGGGGGGQPIAVQPRAQMPGGGGPTAAPGSYRSPAGGLGNANLMLDGPVGQGNIPISPRANLTPDMLAPKTEGRTTPDPVMDPAWSAAEKKKKELAATGGVDIAEILGRYGYAHGGVAEPSDAQKKAGNYRKGHVKFHGLDITIENAKGQTRRGKDPNGKTWEVEMPADYGYVKGTEGADGDHVDVFLGPHAESTTAFIINQCHHITGKFDEHKVMLGYKSEKEACADYCKAFSDGHGAARCKSVETVSIDAFKNWLKSGKTKKSARGSNIVDHAIRHVIGRQARG